ncbi:MAG: ATP synthase F0 subunit B [Elusimicrobia bacterium RIFOXYA2_FULL_58_8]|nr:MAG: ATP synthase F0 subunit B [Elusimicrobia bacterium RIFOXYA12_FULL_57_11]OGS14069.1 MAG: ATP synthase F0 subunit B [Elusimicrobia bacterium RIFOXYA2_FULL_58_8]
MFWTILCFGLLVLLLSKTAWRPLLQAVEERERAIKHDRRSAENARAEAEKIKAELEAGLAELKAGIQARMDEARLLAEKDKDLLIEEARRSAAVIVESSRREIEAQKAEAVRELRGKVAELSIMTAERILMKQLDHRANTDLASKYLAELEKERPDLKLEN